MTMRLRVVHTTRFTYPAPVTSSYNEARLTPQTTATQTTLEAVVRTDPATNTLRYSDYWGTEVTARTTGSRSSPPRWSRPARRARRRRS